MRIIVNGCTVACAIRRDFVYHPQKRASTPIPQPLPWFAKNFGFRKGVPHVRKVRSGRLHRHLLPNGLDLEARPSNIQWLQFSRI